jgi:hypothetical protein
MQRMIPDWLLQLTWFLAGVCATGGFWYFLSQKNHIATLWMGFGALVLALLAVAFHIHNGLFWRADGSRSVGSGIASSAEPKPAIPPPSPSETARDGAPDSPELQAAKIAAADPHFSPMTLEEYFDAWYHKATTSLQRDELERQMLGRRVIWNGMIRSVESKSENLLRIVVEPIDASYGQAFLDFDQSQRQELLRLHEKQKIRFTGVIHSYVASPFLSRCKLLQVLK